MCVCILMYAVCYIQVITCILQLFIYLSNRPHWISLIPGDLDPMYAAVIDSNSLQKARAGNDAAWLVRASL